MSLLGNLKKAKGSTHKPKRVGRGDGSGMGGTSTKGGKGQTARSGGKIRRGFEGGQKPLVQRIPKFGFNSLNPVDYKVFNLDYLNTLNVTEITPDFLYKLGHIKKGELVKVLGRGKLSKSVTVKAHKFSASAKSAIETAGGKTEVIQ